jgi:imidazolonepropionase-like amidohydrolase
MKRLLLFLFFINTLSLVAQETFPVNGTHDKDLVPVAFVNASIQVSPGTLVKNASMLIEKGKIVAIGVGISIPEGVVKYDLKGNFIYPAFIDPYSNYGMPEVKRPEWSPRPNYTSQRKGAFGWNDAIKADHRAANILSHSPAEASSLRSVGFGAVVTHGMDGIARGTSALVALGSKEHLNLWQSDVAFHFSFDKGSSAQNYPSSLMGAIALLRQTYYDALWYKDNKGNIEENLSLEAMQKAFGMPCIFEVDEKWSVLRADKIGDEFGKQFIIKGAGDEYQRIEELKSTEAAFIIPVNFPAAFELKDPFLARMVSLEEMLHWEHAPGNAAVLDSAGIRFAFTAHGLKDKKSFLSNVRKAVKHGLSTESALAALTTVPSKMLGFDDVLGTLEQNKYANFIICSGPIFNDDSKIYETWVGAERFVHEEYDLLDISGNYSLTIGKSIYELSIKQGKKSGDLLYIKKDGAQRDSLKTEIKITQEDKLISFHFELENGPQIGMIRLSGNANLESRIWEGKAQMGDGTWEDWVAVRQAAEPKKEEKGEEKKDDSAGMEAKSRLLYPLSPYGFETLPEAENIVIRNATIWTCDSAGVIPKGEIFISGGKIVAVAEKIDFDALFPRERPQIKAIDAKGKHISPGIIDEHSHIAVQRGVNEGTQSSSAEVSIADVVDPDDINIYRQLSGGVTAAQLLHGSANPIGGQSGIIKLKWGRDAEEMKIENAAPFIKFALGENVKQSNWGDGENIRFPQTRMGVEQVYYDHFIRAKEYGEAWDAYNQSISTVSRKQIRKGELPVKPRRDLELEVLLQILRSERFITCHSYVQSEINMLMHVADSMGFKVNTFTHILEGYKVADKMAEHGAGGSSFSDWWAYKYEVKDAIPYNGALLWEQGVVTAFNSDDAEMARRLNQEAAKAVKYGNVPEEEALKFVTLNPAKLLHLDDRMGSITPGKDADLVIWSDNPLSIYAVAEKTFIEGVCYYDKETDEAMRQRIRLEKSRLSEKMMSAVAGGEETRAPRMKRNRLYHCDTMEHGNHSHGHSGSYEE